MLIICRWKRTCCADGRCYHVQSNVAGAGFVEKSLVIFFLLPLQFALSSPRCNKNNTVASQTKHSHTEAGSLLRPRHAQHRRLGPDVCLKRGPNLTRWQICSAKEDSFAHLVLTLIEISRSEDRTSVRFKLAMRAVKHIHTLLLLLCTDSSGQAVPQTRCSKPCCQWPSSKKHNYRGPRLNNLKNIIIDLYPNSSERYIKI